MSLFKLGAFVVVALTFLQTPTAFSAASSEMEEVAVLPDELSIDVSETVEEKEVDDDGEVEVERESRRATVKIQKQDLERMIQAAADSALAKRLALRGGSDTKAKSTYDTVEPSQADAVARRLTVVSELIKKHGRAYDYRTHTLAELNQILDQLNAGRKRQ